MKSRYEFNFTNYFCWSIQVNKASAGSDTVYVWFKVNGSNIPNSASALVLTGNPAYQLPYVEFISTFTAGDKIEVVIQSADTTAEAYGVAGAGNVPAIPSVITNIYRV